MIYVTSDLHGLEITKLKALLKKACFNENDRLFVLGDVIDRQRALEAAGDTNLDELCEPTAKMTAALQF